MFRGASIRIPSQVKKDGYGYIEDRRPAANCDPYVVTSMIFETVCFFESTKPKVVSDSAEVSDEIAEKEYETYLVDC